MAIDSENKRRSAMNAMFPWMFPILPVADSSMDQGDRQHVCGVYRGIAAESPSERSTKNSRQWGRTEQGTRLFFMKSASNTVRGNF